MDSATHICDRSRAHSASLAWASLHSRLFHGPFCRNFRTIVAELRVAQVATPEQSKQRVLVHVHQGWNVPHGLCHIDIIFWQISCASQWSNGSWRQGVKGKCPAVYVALLGNIIYQICIWKPLFVTSLWPNLTKLCGPHTLMIEYA